MMNIENMTYFKKSKYQWTVFVAPLVGSSNPLSYPMQAFSNDLTSMMLNANILEYFFSNVFHVPLAVGLFGSLFILFLLCRYSEEPSHRMHQPPTSLLHGKPQNPKQMPETGTKGKERKVF
jgi:hypothetical protein